MTKSSTPKELYLVIALTRSETHCYHSSSPLSSNIQNKFIPEGQKRIKKPHKEQKENLRSIRQGEREERQDGREGCGGRKGWGRRGRESGSPGLQGAPGSMRRNQPSPGLCPARCSFCDAGELLRCTALQSVCTARLTN